MAHYEFKLPDIGEGVTEGEVVKWLVGPGTSVKEDQAIVELMTDKATVEIAAPVTGVLISHGATEGSTVKVGAVLATFESSQDQGALPKQTEDADQQGMPPHPVASEPSDTQSSRQGEGKVAPVVLASPATRKLAREHAVDLSQVSGTGPNGRVLKQDVEQWVKSPAQASPDRRSLNVTQPLPTGGEERIPLRGIRKMIAQNMRKSKDRAAHFTHVDELEATELVRVREALQPQAETAGIKLTYLPFIIMAVCRALKDHPKLNATLDEERQEIIIKHYYNIGLAVATKDDDLIVPVIRNADRLGLLDLAQAIDDLASRAKANRLQPEDLKGGTFTITSMGTAGGLMATPIINYPELGILGFHKIEERVVVRQASMAIRKMANVSVSLDHRIVDGMLGAQFLMSFIKYLENPARMLL